MDKYRSIREQRASELQAQSRAQVQVGQVHGHHTASSAAVAAAMAAAGGQLGSSSPSQHVAAATIGFLPHNQPLSHAMAQPAPHHHAIGNVMHSHHTNVQMAPLSSHQVGHGGLNMHQPLEGMPGAPSHHMGQQHMSHQQQHAAQHQVHHHQQLGNGSAVNTGDTSGQTVVTSDSRGV
jgi:hypothetical protein